MSHNNLELAELFRLQEGDKGLRSCVKKNALLPLKAHLDFPWLWVIPRRDGDFCSSLAGWLATWQPRWLPLHLGLLSQTTQCGLQSALTSVGLQAGEGPDNPAAASGEELSNVNWSSSPHQNHLPAGCFPSAFL